MLIVNRGYNRGRDLKTSLSEFLRPPENTD